MVKNDGVVPGPVTKILVGSVHLHSAHSCRNDHATPNQSSALTNTST